MSADLYLVAGVALPGEVDEYGCYSVAYDESSPRQWIGQVSFLKADLHGDWRRWVPHCVEQSLLAYGGKEEVNRAMTPGLRARIMVGFSYPHVSHYERQDGMRGVARAQHVKRFCTAHLGQPTYLVIE